MYTIEVDFEVYKQLTVRRPTEDVTYNDVIRELLGLEQSKQGAVNKTAGPSPEDWVVKGVCFPAGSELRATYKGRTHAGIVQGGSLMLNGKPYESPSAAAVAVTGSAVNGWRFWECKLPGKASWQLIDSLRR